MDKNEPNEPNICEASQVALISHIVKCVFAVLQEAKEGEQDPIGDYIKAHREEWKNWLRKQGCPEENVDEVMKNCEVQAARGAAQIYLQARMETVAKKFATDVLGALGVKVEEEKPEPKPEPKVTNRISAHLN